MGQGGSAHPARQGGDARARGVLTKGGEQVPVVEGDAAMAAEGFGGQDEDAVGGGQGFLSFAGGRQGLGNAQFPGLEEAAGLALEIRYSPTSRKRR